MTATVETRRRDRGRAGRLHRGPAHRRVPGRFDACRAGGRGDGGRRRHRADRRRSGCACSRPSSPARSRRRATIVETQCPSGAPGRGAGPRGRARRRRRRRRPSAPPAAVTGAAAWDVVFADDFDRARHDRREVEHRDAVGRAARSRATTSWSGTRPGNSVLTTDTDGGRPISVLQQRLTAQPVPGALLPGRASSAGCTRRRAARSTTTRDHLGPERRQPRPVPVPLRDAQQREELRLQVRLRGGAGADAEGVRVVARAVAARLEAVELRARRARGLRPRRPHVPRHVLVGERLARLDRVRRWRPRRRTPTARRVAGARRCPRPRLDRGRVLARDERRPLGRLPHRRAQLDADALRALPRRREAVDVAGRAPTSRPTTTTSS